MIDEDELIICDGCGRVMHGPEDIGYMGPVDRTSTECSPYAPFETLCNECKDEEQ